MHLQVGVCRWEAHLWVKDLGRQVIVQMAIPNSFIWYKGHLGCYQITIVCKLHAVQDAELHLDSASRRDCWYRSKNLCIEISQGCKAYLYDRPVA